MTLAGEQLTVVLERGSLSPSLVFETIQKELSRRGLADSQFSYRNEVLGLPEVRSRLETENRKSFRLSGNGFEFIGGTVANHDLDFVDVTEIDPRVGDWDAWAGAFSRIPGFVMAWVVDREFDYWQNASDPLEYEAKGRSFAHLPTTSNGLPPPLNRDVIDTSRNVGRRVLREGYIEAIGSVMWLGAKFWARVGTGKRDLERASMWNLEPFGPDVYRLQVADVCFTGDPTQSAIAGELRRRLYGSA